jgi:hypothetical protein
MRHLRAVTKISKADAYTDFFNAVWRAWLDFRVQKREEKAA